jgi:D-inositol-3-phosphate glycosyltransferase
LPRHEAREESSLTDSPSRIAVLSMHTSPLAPLGGSKAGGMNFYVRQVASQLGGSGLEVDVFTRRDDPGAPEVVELAPGARLVHVDAGQAAPLDNEAMIPLVEEFARGVVAFAAREERAYSLVHSHYWLSVAAGEVVARRWDAPHLATFHTLAEVKLRARASEREPQARIEAERRLVHTVDRVVVATAHERQLLRQIYSLTPDRVSIVPLGVDLQQFQPRDRSEARAALGLPDEGRVLLAVGRMEPLKGFDILIRALPQVTAPGAVTLRIVGGDELAASEFARLREAASEVGVGERVQFVGAVPHEELAVHYNAADLVVVPSFYESFGLVALEAMASGVPVVASRVGGLTATVADGRTGYLVPWRCPEPFAEKIDLLLRNDGLRRALGEAARRSMEPYAWDRVSGALGDVYRSTVAAEAQPAAAIG